MKNIKDFHSLGYVPAASFLQSAHKVAEEGTAEFKNKTALGVTAEIYTAQGPGHWN